MATLIKNASIYVAHLPAIEHMQEHLKQETHTEPLPTQLVTCGFVPTKDNEPALVTAFPGGYAFRFRISQRVIPASVIERAVAEEVQAIERETGRKPGKKGRKAIKEDVILQLAAKSFVLSADTFVYYREATHQLIVPTTSRRVCDRLLGKVVSAVETVKTETIHVSGVSQGLTTRLRKWLVGGDDEFHPFKPCNEAELEQEDRRVKVKMSGLQQAKQTLTSSIDQGFAVAALGLQCDAGEFKLTHDFHLRSIDLTQVEDGAPPEEEPTFEAQAAIEVDQVGQIVDGLLELFGYEPPPVEAA